MIAFLVHDKVQMERDKLEKEPFRFPAESQGNIPSPGSTELDNKTISHSQPLQPIKRFLK